MRLSEEQEVCVSQVVRSQEGKKGHDGHKLSCSFVPDEIIEEVPNYCTRCGEPLSDAERVLDYVTQVISIPELKPVIKEIRHTM